YGGTSGVALALAALYRSTGERVFRRTARAAMDHALGRAGDIEPRSRIGLYSGWYGIAMAGLNCARLLDDEALDAGSRRLVDGLAELQPDSTNCDLLAGCAGAVIGLLMLQEKLGGDRLIGAAIGFGDGLLEAAVRTE